MNRLNENRLRKLEEATSGVARNVVIIAWNAAKLPKMIFVLGIRHGRSARYQFASCPAPRPNIAPGSTRSRKGER